MKKSAFFSERIRMRGLCVFLICMLLPVLAVSSFADNPLVSHVYTADPSGIIVNGRLYVIATHDQDNSSNYDNLHDYYLFSSADLINWQDHGIVFDTRTDTSWARQAFAPDIIYRNGKYYLYFPDADRSIGVAVADSIEGPFSDPLGRPLIDKNMPNANVKWLFDPGVFVDDDGQGYLYFGGGGPGNARVIKLNNDMISTSGNAVTIDAPDFFEASYMHKKNGVYYFSYSTDRGSGQKIDYMTSNDPMTGFRHRGTILENPWDNMNNNSHHSILEYNGQWYMFYHNRAVAIERGASVYQRSICIDRLYYNGDSIQAVNASSTGVPELGNVDAFTRNEGETMDNESGIETEACSEGTTNLSHLENGDWVKISNMDFGSGADTIEVRVASNTNGGIIEVILDNMNNQPVGSVQVGNTNGWQSWQTVSASIDTVTGLHDLYLRFTGGNGTLFNVNWYRFTGEGSSTAAIGDVNNDGSINIVDALLTARFYVGLDPDGFDEANADVDCNGEVTITDALLMARYYVGLISRFC